MTRLVFHTAQGPRENLEDTCFALRLSLPPLGKDMIPVFGVLDGAGGHEAGEVASGLGSACISASLVQSLVGNFLGIGPESVTPETRLRMLTDALHAGNQVVLECAAESTACVGMATTTVCGFIRDHILYMAWAGDSRGYLHTGGRLKPLTRDHSRTRELIDAGLLTPEEAPYHPDAHCITRYLGQAQGFEPQTRLHPIRPGDVVLLCTDGLTDVLDDSDIQSHIDAAHQREGGFGQLPEQLVAAALAAGTTDNTTVLCLQYQPTSRLRLFPDQTFTGQYAIAAAESLQAHLTQETPL